MVVFYITPEGTTDNHITVIGHFSVVKLLCQRFQTIYKYLGYLQIDQQDLKLKRIYLAVFRLAIPGWPEASQEVCCLSVHVAVNGEELPLEQLRDQLAQSSLATPGGGGGRDDNGGNNNNNNSKTVRTMSVLPHSACIAH